MIPKSGDGADGGAIWFPRVVAILSADMSTPSKTSPVYLIIGPVGEEDGPYTMEELRQRLVRGRLRRDDRLRNQDQGTIHTVEELIEDVEALEEEARHHARRVRRTSEERRAAVAEAEAAAAAAAAADSPPPQPTENATPPVAEELSSAVIPTEIQQRRIRLALIAAGIALVVGVLWNFLPERDPGMLRVEVIQGYWTLDERALGTLVSDTPHPELRKHVQRAADQLKQRLGGITIHLQDQVLTVEKSGVSSQHECRITGGDSMGLGFQLSPPHPLLGAEVAFFRTGSGLELQIQRAELRAPIYRAFGP